uniref:Virion structural protein n=1 Tax=Pseudomonas phage RVTF4 TaxID=3236931 RepID=A0AB39CCX6_9VIRU
MYIKDVKETLLNAFNKKTGLNLTVADVNFQSPGVWLQDGCNAKVTIAAKATSEYATGMCEILYNRYKVADALVDIRLDGNPGDYANTTDVLRYLREVNNVSAYDEDFYHVEISPTATSVVLTPRIDALVWLPPDPVTLIFDPK